MSIEILHDLFSKLLNVGDWRISAFRYNQKSAGMEYTCCALNFGTQKDTNLLVQSLCTDFTTYTLNRCTSIEDYTGFNGKTTISKISLSDDSISANYNLILQSIENSSDSIDFNNFKANSYIIKGTLNIDNEIRPVLLISAKNPNREFKKCKGLTFFSAENNTFTPFTQKLLQLFPYFHIIIYDSYLYLNDIDGEKILDLERTYKKKCAEDLTLIQTADIVSDFDAFKIVAFSNHNPRKFLTFNQESLNKLITSKPLCQDISSKFSIPYSSSTGKFDLSDKNSAERFIKFLCDKAVLDPIEQTAKEASAIKNWN